MPGQKRDEEMKTVDPKTAENVPPATAYVAVTRKTIGRCIAESNKSHQIIIKMAVF